MIQLVLQLTAVSQQGPAPHYDEAMPVIAEALGMTEKAVRLHLSAARLAASSAASAGRTHFLTRIAFSVLHVLRLSEAGIERGRRSLPARPSGTDTRKGHIVSKLGGAFKVIRGMKQEADGKALSDPRLRDAGRRLVTQGHDEIRRHRP
ncbi:hypothetical protein [Streptomyces cinereoruber]|uniref:hypothetical protein n=1 Tax=Streptomyces cinereoruber TaxID=67260 RepID=UPI0036425C33